MDRLLEPDIFYSTDVSLTPASSIAILSSTIRKQALENGPDERAAPAMEDQELVRLLAKHDRELLRYIMMFLPRRADAEEVLQRTAVMLWEKLPEYDTQRDFLPWALHRAYYEVLNFRKEAARSKLIFSEEIIQLLATERSDQAVYLADMKDALNHCVDKMQPFDRQLLKCRYAGSQSISDMAIEFGKTAKSLYRRLDRLRALLADCIAKRVETGESDSHLGSHHA